MSAITINQLANRIAKKINDVERKDRDFTKSDFRTHEPLPTEVHNEFVAEFPFHSQTELNEFTLELHRLVEA